MVPPGAEPVSSPAELQPFIYLAGGDGTGKTTQAGLLLDGLRARGIPARSLWLRFPFFFCLPLLAYARLRGFSRSQVVGGARYGYWDLDRSRLLRAVFPWALLCDAACAALLRVYLPLALGYTLVCERFVVDMLVDLMLGLGDPTLHLKRPGRLFLRLLPAGASLLLLDLDQVTICARRVELRADRRLADRLVAYRRLAVDLDILVLQTTAPPGEVHQQILEILAIGRDNRPLPDYGHFRAGLPAAILRFPTAALASHWTFQGFFCMRWSERFFKLALDAFLTLLLAAVLRLALPWPAALLGGFLLAHTLNFLFNGHLWGALKHYGLVAMPWEEFDRYAAGVLDRAGRQPSVKEIKISGSLARRVWTPVSDFDARLVPAPGILSRFLACCFLLQERSRALLARFPLDIYLE